MKSIKLFESGFYNKTGDNIVRPLSNLINRISNIGIDYNDQLIKNSLSIGVTEATSSVTDPDLIKLLSMVDLSQKKFIPYYQQQYDKRREFLRSFALNPEIDWMVTTITDEAIVYDENNYFAYLKFNNIDLKEDVIETINDYYKMIYYRFGFNNDITAWEYFKQLLIDGTLAFEIIYDEDFTEIIGFKEIDTAYLKLDIEKDGNSYKKIWIQYPDDNSKKRILYDNQVIYISLAKGNMPSKISYVENLVRSFNLLRIVENSQVMWLLMNSAWRMKMVVPIRTNSPQKAKESLGEMMSYYKEDITLDPTSGELSVNGTSSMQYYKNYLFPSKDGDTVSIESIQNQGPDISNSDLVSYLKQKLQDNSKIPPTRFSKENNGGSYGGATSATIDREEIRFFNLINRYRSIFQEIILKPLYIQIVLKYPDLDNDENFKSSIGLIYNSNNIFEELKNQDIYEKRIQFIKNMSDLKDDEDKPYFDIDFLIKKYMNLDESDIEMNKKIKNEKKKNKEEKKEKNKNNEENEEPSTGKYGF